MADDNDVDADDSTEDFAESLAIAHHIAILDLVAVIAGMSGAPTDRLNEIRDALTAMLPPEDIEFME